MVNLHIIPSLITACSSTQYLYVSGSQPFLDQGPVEHLESVRGPPTWRIKWSDMCVHLQSMFIRVLALELTLRSHISLVFTITMKTHFPSSKEKKINAIVSLLTLPIICMGTHYVSRGPPVGPSPTG